MNRKDAELVEALCRQMGFEKHVEVYKDSFDVDLYTASKKGRLDVTLSYASEEDVSCSITLEHDEDRDRHASPVDFESAKANIDYFNSLLKHKA